jgi:hypothetical protein
VERSQDLRISIGIGVITFISDGIAGRDNNST